MNSVLIHEFYANVSEIETPVHLTVDTSLAGDTMGIRAYTSNQLSVGGVSLGAQFQSLPVHFKTLDTEKTAGT